jgi:methyl-accepting chemotaxis protein
VAVAERAGRLVADIVPGIQKTAELVQEINASSDEQARGVEQITKAIQQLDQVIQQNASGAEEMSSTAEELNSQAEQLIQNLGIFQIDGGGAAVKRRAGAKPVRAALARPAASIKAPHRGNGGLHPELGTNTGEGIRLELGDATDKDFERFDA